MTQTVSPEPFTSSIILHFFQSHKINTHSVSMDDTPFEKCRLLSTVDNSDQNWERKSGIRLKLA